MMVIVFFFIFFYFYKWGIKMISYSVLYYFIVLYLKVINLFIICETKKKTVYEKRKEKIARMHTQKMKP